MAKSKRTKDEDSAPTISSPVIKASFPTSPQGQPTNQGRSSGDPKSNATSLTMREDRHEVFEQMRMIESCRSLVFLATLAAVGASIVGTAQIVAPMWEDRPEVAMELLCTGLALTLTFLTIGILTTVVKVKEINMRVGYALALEDRLGTNTPPRHYYGWAHAHLLLACSTSLKTAARSLIDNPTLPPDVWREGEAIAHRINQHKRPFTSGLSSFGALTGAVYIFAFVAVYAGLAICAHSALTKIHNIDDWAATLFFVGFGAIGIGLHIGLWYNRHSWILTRKWSRARKSMFVLISSVVLLALTIAPLWFAIRQIRGEVLSLPFLLTGALTAVFTFFGLYLMMKLRQCRRGKHSVECYYYTWRMALDCEDFDFYTTASDMATATKNRGPDT